MRASALSSISLGAGNRRQTVRSGDDGAGRRVQVHPLAGSALNAIRQNSLFKDFYFLAEHDTTKRKELYVIGTQMPLKFLNSGRALASVMSRNQQTMGRSFNTSIAQGYQHGIRLLLNHRKGQVQILDLLRPPASRIHRTS